MKKRTAKYVYINTHPSGTEGSVLKRSTLIQTTVSLKKGDPVLVFYGSEYMISAMPAEAIEHALDMEQT